MARASTIRCSGCKAGISPITAGTCSRSTCRGMGAAPVPRLERLAPGVLYSDLKACNDYASALDSAAKVKCPVLMILGARDVMTPLRGTKELKEALKAKTAVIDFSGHSLMVEAPDATLDALIEFFRP